MDDTLIQQLDELPAEMLEQLAVSAGREMDRRRQKDPVSIFPWHRIQSWVLEAPNLTESPVRIILVAGGNRGGKSKTGMGIYADVIRRKSPLNRQLTATDPITGENRVKGPDDPLNVWVIPPTLEKARQDWLAPSDRMGLKYWAGDRFLHHRETPDNVIYTKVPGLDPWMDDERLDYTMCDKTILKSQDQALHTFESSEVDLALVDEEIQDESKWNSMLLRIATTNGVLVMTYTPLNGLSWSYDRYWKPLVKAGRAHKIADRCWMHDPEKGATVICAQMGSRDNPRARKYADEIEEDPRMSDSEKRARLYGEYGFVEGTLIRQMAGLDVTQPDGHHKLYVVDQLPGEKTGKGRTPGRIERWMLVADPNKSYGAVLMAVDQDDNLFLVSEHLEESWPNRRHAAAFKEMINRWATGDVEKYADPGSAGVQSMLDLADFGLYFLPVPKGAGSVSSSVKTLRGRAYIDPKHRHPITGKLGAPRIYVYRPGMVQEHVETGRKVLSCRTVEQISLARQTDNQNAPPDTPHKSVRSKLDLFDCVRYGCVIAAQTGQSEEEQAGAARPTEDTLVLKKEENDDFMHEPFYVPDYDFSEVF